MVLENLNTPMQRAVSTTDHTLHHIQEINSEMDHRPKCKNEKIMFKIEKPND